MTHGQLDIGARGSHIYDRHCDEQKFEYEISAEAPILLDIQYALELLDPMDEIQ